MPNATAPRTCGTRSPSYGDRCWTAATTGGWKPRFENIRAEIVDAGDLLAELELDAGRPDRSARAARTGLASDPYAEQLWRALMRAEYEAGNISRVHEAWKACLKAVAEVSADGDPHPETAALYRKLANTRRPG
uniref:bacterial transcriptional activator domain-containing protein n=1 Tax=Microbispora cellulosiformans TaxID=2614688 RepID=UPI0017828989